MRSGLASSLPAHGLPRAGRSGCGRFEEETPGTYATGTYTVTGRKYVFREETNEKDELIGRRGKKGVISGTLYKNGQPTEFSFTLTPTS